MGLKAERLANVTLSIISVDAPVSNNILMGCPLIYTFTIGACRLALAKINRNSSSLDRGEDNCGPPSLFSVVRR